MTFSPDSAGAVSGGTLPSSTYRHIRIGVVWALALFAIAITPLLFIGLPQALALFVLWL